ncbi:2675_t:CDS:2, partial [Acaulospora colombiana]
RDTPSFARDLTRGVMSQWSADSSLDPVISAGHAARRARWRQVARNRAAREVEEQLLLAAMAVNMDEESDNWTQILEELPAGGIHDLTAISDHSEMNVEVETGSGEETIDAEDVPETNAGRLSEALGFNQPATSGSANWGESENLWHSSQSRAGDWEPWPLRLPPTSPLPNPPVRQSSTRGLDSSIVDQSTNPPIPRTFGFASRLSSLRELNRRTTHLPSAYHTPPEPTNGFASSSNAIPVLPSALPVPETNPPLFTASPEPMTTTIGSPLLLPRGLSEFRGTRRTRIFSPFPATSPAPHLNSVRARPFADRIFGGTFFGGQSFSSPLFDEDEDDHDYLDMNEMQTDGEERLEIAGFDFGLPGTESEGVLFVGIGNPLRSSGTKNQSRLLEFDMTRSYSVPGKEETEAKDDLPRGYRVGIGRRYAQGDFA